MKKHEIECSECRHRETVDYDTAKAAERGELRCRRDVANPEGAEARIDMYLACSGRIKRVFSVGGFTMDNKDRVMLGEDL